MGRYPVTSKLGGTTLDVWDSGSTYGPSQWVVEPDPRDETK